MAHVDFGAPLPNETGEEFLLDYTNEENGWYLWLEVPQVQRRWWRRDFDGFSVVIEEAEHAVKTKMTGVNFPRTTMIMHMYMIDGDLPLESYVTCKKEILARLRDITRDGGTV